MSNPILEEACGLSTEPIIYPVTHVFARCKSMSSNVFHKLSKNVKSQGLDCREDVEHHLAFKHVPREISHAITVHANMICCVRHKEDMGRWISRPSSPSAVKKSHYTSLSSSPVPIIDVRRTHMTLISFSAK